MGRNSAFFYAPHLALVYTLCSQCLDLEFAVWWFDPMIFFNSDRTQSIQGKKNRILSTQKHLLTTCYFKKENYCHLMQP